MSDVTVRRGSSLLLSRVSLQVDEGQRWVVLGPNGAGKTTLMLIAAGRLFPTSGDVELLDEAVGAVSMSELRSRIGWASSALAADIPSGESVSDVVMTGAHAVTGRWREEYGDQDRVRAARLMGDWGVDGLAHRTFGTLSEGERKRTLIARSLMADPELLLLDEPGAGLDLGGREDLVARMTRLAMDPHAPTQIVVTHHVEEIPEGFTHALLLRAGSVVAAGPIGAVLTAPLLSAAFGLALEVRGQDGRWHARRASA
ncbi:MAG: Iron transporter ATP-binding protein [Actinomycetota bacterium]|jgi:iron complex transport system ATP-binding protein|nr:Iron transporter ATP-binding protein [Actinomycetota bacterium]